MIKRIFRELKASWLSLSLIPKPYNKYKLFRYIDMIYCIVKYGALSDDYISLKFFEKSSKERAEYVTSGNKRLFYKAFYDDDARKTLAHKNLFSERFKDFVKRDWIYTANSSIEDIRKFIESHDEVVIKPTNSTWGIGISVINSTMADKFIDKYKAAAGKEEYMIEEKLINHPDVAKLNPVSLQTLRVETCIDQNGEFHLLNVLLMIGTKKIIVSNCHSGGVMCHVDMTTGKIDKEGYNPKGYWLASHPETGINFVGYKVPMIEELESYIRRVSQVMPNARYVGWDVAITPKGFELIEGNFCPGQCTQTCDGIPKYEILKSYI